MPSCLVRSLNGLAVMLPNGVVWHALAYQIKERL
jgi:hypothetical protein